MTVALHVAPLIFPISAAPIVDGAIAVADGVIVGVGPADQLSTIFSDAETTEWSGVLTPGFVNAHTHSEYGPSFSDLASSGLPFPQWMLELVKRWESRTEADWAADAHASAEQMLSTGTTAFADIVTIGPGITAAADRGMRGVSYVEMVACDDASWPARSLALQGILDAAPASRAVGVSPHTLYTISLSVFEGCQEIARERGLRLHPHLAETSEESEYVLSGTGALADNWRKSGLSFEVLEQGGMGITPAQLLDRLGGLAPDTHVAHGVHIEASDRQLLRDKGVAVALCARSNKILGSGEAPVRGYLEEGSLVGVGTDSLSSCPDLNMLNELKALKALAIKQGMASEGLDELLLEAATVGGAQAMGLDRIGALEAGALADFVHFESDPIGGAAALIHEGSASATFLDGKQVA